VRRLRWIKDQAYKQSISRDGSTIKRNGRAFEYVDADGVVTNRTITMWEKRGAYIVGYDKSRKAERTFRQDRISEWVSADPRGEPRLRTGRPYHHPPGPHLGHNSHTSAAYSGASSGRKRAFCDWALPSAISLLAYRLVHFQGVAYD
jgi:hypothetical protein